MPSDPAAQTPRQPNATWRPMAQPSATVGKWRPCGQREADVDHRCAFTGAAAQHERADPGALPIPAGPVQAPEETRAHHAEEWASLERMLMPDYAYICMMIMIDDPGLLSHIPSWRSRSLPILSGIGLRSSKEDGRAYQPRYERAGAAGPRGCLRPGTLIGEKIPGECGLSVRACRRCACRRSGGQRRVC